MAEDSVATKSAPAVSQNGSASTAQDAERLWARREAKKAVRIFKLRPIEDFRLLKQGDVLVSRTRTLRLVLDSARVGDGVQIMLLKYTPDREIGIETTLTGHLDPNRFRAVLSRRLENPLGNMGDIPGMLEREVEIFHNVKVLLGCGSSGKQLFDAVRVKYSNEERYVTLKLFVGGQTGDILGLEPKRSFSIPTEVDFLINAADVPSDEFIKRVAFEKNAAPLVRRNILFAAMLV